ncbi:uncharacterized protein LOC120647793 [Panicum virgatum]|uniref:uncharacterized protein LOC120647793 n=1 Tax=Panicum virgatum TaxID=38727 RepID=UPI0019D569CA|nr:uncharacterized protein LOC120647793 [Panicum virgatum]
MDGGSGLNIMYAEMLDAMGIDRSQLRPSGAPFHGVVPGKQALPIGQIDLPVTFGDPTNFRTETLTFEVVGFSGTYHTLLGRPCYAKFMAVPNYTYLKLKMPGPRGVITVGTSFQHAFQCEKECCEHATTVIASEELIVLKAEHEEGPLDSNGKKSGSFQAAVDTKEIEKSALVDFLRANKDIFAWKPSDMPGIPREVAEHALKINRGSKPVKQ